MIYSFNAIKNYIRRNRFQARLLPNGQGRSSFEDAIYLYNQIVKDQVPH